MLDDYRYVLLRKLDGINNEQARRAVTAGDLTMLGLARHLAFVEQFWFGHIFLDAVGSTEDWLYDDNEDPDVDLHPGEHDSLAEAIDRLHAQIPGLLTHQQNLTRILGCFRPLWCCR